MVTAFFAKTLATDLRDLSFTITKVNQKIPFVLILSFYLKAKVQ